METETKVKYCRSLQTEVAPIANNEIAPIRKLTWGSCGRLFYVRSMACIGRPQPRSRIVSTARTATDSLFGCRATNRSKAMPTCSRARPQASAATLGHPPGFPRPPGRQAARAVFPDETILWRLLTGYVQADIAASHSSRELQYHC